MRFNHFVYYRFLIQEECLESLNNIFENFSEIKIKNSLKLYKNMESFISSHFDNDWNMIRSFYSIILFKSLSNHSIYQDTPEKKNMGMLINSDQVINELTDIFTNLIIFDLNTSLKKKIFIKTKDMRSHFFRILAGFSFEGIIIEKNKTFYEKKKLKTLIFYGLTKEINILNSFETLKINFSGFEIIKLNKTEYLVGNHFSSVHNIYRKNWNSNIRFEFKNNDYFNLIKNNEIFLDIDSLKKIIKTIENMENIIFDDLEKNIIILKKKLNELISKENKILEDYLIIKNIQKEISKKNIYNQINLLEKLNIPENKKIFFPFYFDFRGRFYVDSPVGTTQLKIARCFYHYGWYDECEDYVEDSRITEIIEKYRVNITCILLEYNLKETKKNISSVFWILISIGKIFVNKSDIKIEISTFIDLGFKKIKNISKENLDLEGLVEYEHYLNIIKEMSYCQKNMKKMKKMIIIKDATASVIQNLMLLLGPLNENSLFIANLKSNRYWIDTYSYILTEFIKTLDEDDLKSKYLNFFIRKTIKKSIMTIPYSASFNTCFDYLNENILEIFNIKFDEDEEKELKKLFYKFYNFVKKKMENDFLFKNDSKKMIDYIIYENIINKKKEKKKNINDFILESTDGIINFVYNNMNQKYIDLLINFEKDGIIQKKRKTKKYFEIIESSINYNKIRNSLRANWIHFMDAVLIRKINIKFGKPILTVHDCLLVDIYSVSKIMGISNNIMNEKIDVKIGWDNSHNYKIFSIFIFL